MLAFWQWQRRLMVTIIMVAYDAVCAADSKTLMCRMHGKVGKWWRWDDRWLIEQWAWCYAPDLHHTILQSATKLHYITLHQNSPYSIAEHRVPKLIPVLGSRPAGDASHKPGGRLPLLPPGLQLPPQPLRGLLSLLLLGEQMHYGCEQFA